MRRRDGASGGGKGVEGRGMEWKGRREGGGRRGTKKWCEVEMGRKSYIWSNDFFFRAEDGIRAAQESRGLGGVYKRRPVRRL